MSNYYANQTEENEALQADAMDEFNTLERMAHELEEMQEAPLENRKADLAQMAADLRGLNLHGLAQVVEESYLVGGFEKAAAALENAMDAAWENA